MESEAVVAALCPKTMKTGSMRMLPYAIWLAGTQTGTNRLAHSSRLGQMLR